MFCMCVMVGGTTGNPEATFIERNSNLNVNTYPGTTATPLEIIRLAQEYQASAKLLMQQGRKGVPISRAPARLCAIHAIELYLNAYLLHFGVPPEKVRSHFHDLGKRAGLIKESGLILRKRTVNHLEKLTETREYLISRYGPEMSLPLSQINRLMATLDEVAQKVTSAVNPG